MASRIAPKISLPDRFGQRGKSQLRAPQRILLGGHVAVPKLISKDRIGFGPYPHHRLVASAFLIMIVGPLLVTLDNRGILIHRRDPLGLALLFIEPGNPPHQAALDLL